MPKARATRVIVDAARALEVDVHASRSFDRRHPRRGTRVASRADRDVLDSNGKGPSRFSTA